MSLKKYTEKRHFEDTPEPKAKVQASRGQLKFVVQRHQASHLHYDMRLEMEGVLKSWAVPKGPSLNPKDKRLAMQTEDHPYEYLHFKGTIPEGNYGAGEMDIWDSGTYQAVDSKSREESEEMLLAGLKKGHIQFIFHGKKLKGAFDLIHTKSIAPNAWLLVKREDEEAVDDAYSAEDH